MSQKSILNGSLLVNKLPIAICYLLATSTFSQSLQEIKILNKSINKKDFSILNNDLKKNTLSVSQLKTMAQNAKIPFSGITKGRKYQLQGFTTKGLPLYYITNNRDASETIGTSKIHNEGGVFDLEGSGIIIREWDGGGVRLSHQEFEGRVIQKDGDDFFSDHATHVAGTLVAAGTNKRAKGMAPKAELHSYNWTDDMAEMVEAINQGALVSNHSYGFLGGFEFGNWAGEWNWHWFGNNEDTEYIGYGHYGQTDAQWDLISKASPYYLPVRAAGNPRGDGPDEGESHYAVVNDKGTLYWEKTTKKRQKNGGEFGYDCINKGSTAKNILLVGAAEKISKNQYTKASDVVPASFSAFGPTDDGRIKPDITSIGVGIHSTVETSDSAYSPMDGTSMASPTVTGSLALLQEHYKKLYGTIGQPFMKSATLKALAIHTANEAGDHDGPDYKFGWGLMNTYKAAETLSLKGTYSLIEEKTLNNGSFYTSEVVARGNEPLIVTIVWDDPVLETENMPEETLDNPKSVLVNDLDIRIFDEQNNEFFPWILNPYQPNKAAIKGDNNVDNVEQIVIPNAIAGKKYTIKVSHKNTLRNNEYKNDKILLVNSQKQDFSLIATGINNNVTKDLAVNNIFVPSPMEFTAKTPIKIEVENKAEEAISGAILKYKMFNKDENKEIITGEVSLPNITKGEKNTQIIHLDLSKSFVNYSIEAEIFTTEDQISVNNKKTTTAFGYIAEVLSPESVYTFSFEEDFNKSGWEAEDLDKDGRTWGQYEEKKFARTGENLAINHPNARTGGTNDWLYSNPIKIKGNTPYRVSFYIMKYQLPYEGLEVFIGNEKNHSTMKSLGTKIEAKEENFTKYYYEFQVDTDQTIYLGFNHKIDASAETYAIGLEDVRLQFAEGKPEIDFIADNKFPNTYEAVTFTNGSISSANSPITHYQWTFEPNTISYIEGDSTSKDIKVKFNEETTYDVSLKATNSAGESISLYSKYIDVKNTPTEADFKNTISKIFQGEEVHFTNNSVGYPYPTEFDWKITPSEGFDLVGETNKNSQNISLKFNKAGKYTVALKATSLANSNEIIKTDLVEVTDIHQSVRDLKHSYNKNNKELKLFWEKPNKNPVYFESFEEGFIPDDIMVFNDSTNDRAWEVDNFLGANYGANKSSYNAISFSWMDTPLTANHWLLSPKMNKGLELLQYSAYFPNPEKYDVYIVKAPTDGIKPTLEHIKAGKIVYSSDPSEKVTTFVNREIDISQHTQEDFYIAFHHKTTDQDNGLFLALDDIYIGYKQHKPDFVSNKSVEKYQKLIDYKKSITNKNKVTSRQEIKSYTEMIQQVRSTPTYKTFGMLNMPYLIGYEIYKDNNKLADITDIEHLYLLDNVDISNNNTHIYDVYAIYSDGIKSEKVSITISANNLSASETKLDNLKVYPNPSDGRFVIDAKFGVSKLDTQVYDMSGKLIFKKEYQGNKADLNLTQYPKGIYLLNVVDNNGQKQIVKLMIK